MIFSQMDIDSLQQSIIVIVIQPENLNRMRKADPVTLEAKVRGGMLMPARYPNNVSVLVAYEDDEGGLYERIRTGGVMGLLEYLERGRQWLPVDGLKYGPPTGRMDS